MIFDGGIGYVELADLNGPGGSTDSTYLIVLLNFHNRLLLGNWPTDY